MPTTAEPTVRRFWALFCEMPGGEPELHSIHSGSRSANETLARAMSHDPDGWYADYHVEEHDGRELAALLGV